MASSLSPTASNILSSLGIKGATVDKRLPGCVPVLNERGEIDELLIPGIGSAISSGRIGNVAVVDPAADGGSDSSSGFSPTGSVMAPFRSLEEAAAGFVPYGPDADSMVFLMAPGVYGDVTVTFSGSYHPLRVYFIGMGECRMSEDVTFGGLSPAQGGVNPSISFFNVVSNGTVKVLGSPTVSCRGGTYLSELLFGDADSAVVRIASDSRVSSTNAAKVYMSDSGNVGNTSEVTGVTVEDALDRLGGRKIRMASLTFGSSGVDVESSYVDVSAESAGSCDVFDISERDRVIAEGVNGFFRRGRFQAVSAGSVTAGTVDAGTVKADSVNAGTLKFGSYAIRVDSYGYLVVGEESDSSSSSS